MYIYNIYIYIIYIYIYIYRCAGRNDNRKTPIPPRRDRPGSPRCGAPILA